jgi:hypothetical protein
MCLSQDIIIPARLKSVSVEGGKIQCRLLFYWWTGNFIGRFPVAMSSAVRRAIRPWEHPVYYSWFINIPCRLHERLRFKLNTLYKFILLGGRRHSNPAFGCTRLRNVMERHYVFRKSYRNCKIIIAFARRELGRPRKSVRIIGAAGTRKGSLPNTSLGRYWYSWHVLLERSQSYTFSVRRVFIFVFHFRIRTGCDVQRYRPTFSDRVNITTNKQTNNANSEKGKHDCKKVPDDYWLQLQDVFGSLQCRSNYKEQNPLWKAGSSLARPA